MSQAKDNKKKKLAAQIVRRLRRYGFEAYFIGGCVRDMLMRKDPKDIDIVTGAKPAQIEKIFPGPSFPVGARFGTLLVVKDKIPFQVSTFRGEKKRYSLNLSEDVAARDFTINGLAYDPLKRRIIDLVGGKNDIRRRRICAIGQANSRFAQDPLRLIRAVRFAASLEFSIERQTWQAISKMAAKITTVSKERIRDELILILTSVNPAGGLKMLDESTILKYILPRVDELKGVAQPRAFHPEGDVFVHTLLMLKQLKKPSLVLSLACLLHDVGKPPTFQVSDRIRFSGHDKVGADLANEILKDLRFSNKDREAVVACVGNHMRMMEAPKMRRATLKRLLARSTFKEELRLHRIDCIASHRDLSVWHFLSKKYKEFKKTPQISKPILNGHELIKIGFTPGPIFGTIHRQMLDMQLEGKIKTKSETRVWVVNNFRKERQGY